MRFPSSSTTWSITTKALIACLFLSLSGVTSFQQNAHSKLRTLSMKASKPADPVKVSPMNRNDVNDYAKNMKLTQIYSKALAGEAKKRDMLRVAAKRVQNKAVSAVQGTMMLGQRESANESALSEQEARVMEGGWRKRGKGSAIFRTLEVWGFAFSFLLRELKLRKIEDKEELSRMRYENGRFIRDNLLKLGPTFIKLGQLLSTRIDLLCKEYIEELSSLQDRVPGFDGKRSVFLIEQEFGKPIDQLFDSFELEPIAAASLGQVHIATRNGTKLAIKVQREGLRDLFDTDLKNLKLLAVLLDKFDPKFDGADRDWVSIYEESARLLYKEIDYENEGRNAERFANNFRDVEWVKVPEIYWETTSKRVLTMEYVDGIKINDINRIDKAGIDRELLAKRSAESYLAQLCRYGFFHCDPHPGNLACDAEFGGRLIYYDFGMMDDFTQEVRAGLVDLIFGIYENNAVETCDALEDMGILKRGSDRVSVERIARFFLGEFQNTLAGDSVQLNQLPKEDVKKIRRERRAKLGEELLSVGNDVPFQFPPTFTFVFRAFTSLDGIGKGLSKSYDLTKLAQPFLQELLDLKDGSLASSLAKKFLTAVGWRPEDIASLVQQPRRVAKVTQFTNKLEQGDLKLRVRVLEAERAFERMTIVQGNLFAAILAAGLANFALLVGSPTGTALLAVGEKTALVLSRLCLLGAALSGGKLLGGLLKLRSLDKKNLRYSKKAATAK